MKKMVFKEDKFVNGVIFAKAGEPVDVEEGSVHRWMIRGGQVVEDVKVESPDLHDEEDLDDDGEEVDHKGQKKPSKPHKSKHR